MWTGVVAGESQIDAAEAVNLREQISGGAIEVLVNISGFYAEKLRRLGHQLAETGGALRAACGGPVGALRFDHRPDAQRPIVRGDVETLQRRMITVACRGGLDRPKNFLSGRSGA